MGLPAGIGRVAVIVADVLNLFEICFQDLDVSIDEGAIIFFLAKIESCVIGCFHFGRSFHGGVLFDFVRGMGVGRGWSVEIDFAFQN